MSLLAEPRNRNAPSVADQDTAVPPANSCRELCFRAVKNHTTQTGRRLGRACLFHTLRSSAIEVRGGRCRGVPLGFAINLSKVKLSGALEIVTNRIRERSFPRIYDINSDV